MNIPSRLLQALAVVSLLGSCSLPPEGRPNRCVSNASLVNPEARSAPGIGGTGQVASRPGIGGTGIVGVVTGFASICVNGEEIHYTQATPVLRDGEPGSIRDLQVGQVVAVQTTALGAESGSEWLARQIVVQYALIGPLSRVEPGSGRFEIMGEQALALSPEDLAGLQAGDWVRVSGHRQADGGIRAGRVEALGSAAKQAQIQGPVTSLQGRTARVGNTPVQFSVLPGAVQAGREILLRGQWDGQRLQVQETLLQPTFAALQGSDRVLLQAYVRARRGNTLELGYESVQLPEKITPPEVNQQILIRGRIHPEQGIVAEQISVGSDQGNRGGFSQAGRGNAGPSNHGARGNGAAGGGGGNAGNAGGGGGGNGGGGNGGNGGGGGSGGGGSR